MKLSAVNRQQALGLVLATASLAAAAFAGKAAIDQNRESAARDRYAHCQAQVDDELVKALTARSDSSAARTDATDEFIAAVFHAKSQAEVLQLYQQWQAARDKANKDRQNNPLPQPPSNTCHF